MSHRVCAVGTYYSNANRIKKVWAPLKVHTQEEDAPVVVNEIIVF